MMNRMVDFFLNERPLSVPEGTSLDGLRTRFKPGADILIRNGAPAAAGDPVREGDRIVLIKRGEVPAGDELEALMYARHTPGVHERLKSASVAVAGLGGLGSTAAVALARIGIGRLILVDYDIVEPSNLNRQVYLIEHIGKAKSEAMTALLQRVNPFVRVDAHRVELTPRNIPDLLSTADVILECFDRAEAKIMLLETVARRLPDTWLVLASGVAGYGNGNDIQVRRLDRRIFVVGDMVSGVETGRGLMAPRVGIAAHQQADLAVSLILDSDAAVSRIPEAVDPVLGR